jgi:hypothetical protein
MHELFCARSAVLVPLRLRPFVALIWVLRGADMGGSSAAVADGRFEPSEGRFLLLS